MTKWCAILIGIVFLPSLSAFSQVRSAATLYNEAITVNASGKSSAALQLLTEALLEADSVDTIYADILSLRGFWLAQQGQLSEGIKDLELACELDTTDLGLLLNLSFMYGENGQVFNCVSLLKTGLSRDSSNVVLLNNMAYYCAKAEDFQSAVLYAEKGLAIAKDSTWIGSLLNTLGFAVSKTESTQKGLNLIKKSVSFKPQNPYAYVNMALVYVDMGQKEMACDNFELAREYGGVNLAMPYLKRYCYSSND